MDESQLNEVQNLHPFYPSHILIIGRLTIDLLARRVSRDGQALHVGVLEFNLLIYLTHHAGRAVPYSELWREIWRYDEDINKNINKNNDAIKCCVERLRQAIEPDPKQPRYVFSVRSHGYLMPTSIDD